jgi:hypothetical protein
VKWGFFDSNRQSHSFRLVDNMPLTPDENHFAILRTPSRIPSQQIASRPMSGRPFLCFTPTVVAWQLT